VPYPPDIADARLAALDASVRFHAAIRGDLALQIGIGRDVTISEAEQEIRATADNFAAWLLGPTRIALARSQVVSQATGQPTGTSNEGAPMQIHDDEKFALTVDTKDARGFETADSITWTADDDGAVISLQVSDDSRSCEVLAVAPGSAVITVSDDAAGLSVTEAVDVVAGGTATIGLVEGDVEKQ
jgi:hypothetical protein